MKCILLDADVIVRLFEFGLFYGIASQHQVVISETVADEVKYYDDPASGIRTRIDLRSCVTKIPLQFVDVSPVQYALLDSQLAKYGAKFIDDGETASLALLAYFEPAVDFICLADMGAITAAVLIGLETRCISLERLLKMTGLSRKLPPQLTENAFKFAVNKANQRRIALL